MIKEHTPIDSDTALQDTTRNFLQYCDPGANPEEARAWYKDLLGIATQHSIGIEAEWPNPGNPVIAWEATGRSEYYLSKALPLVRNVLGRVVAGPDVTLSKSERKEVITQFTKYAHAAAQRSLGIEETDPRKGAITLRDTRREIGAFVLPIMESTIDTVRLQSQKKHARHAIAALRASRVISPYRAARLRISLVRRPTNLDTTTENWNDGWM